MWKIDNNNKLLYVKKTLEITGGALKPAKCYWYLINFLWENKEWSYKITATLECKILGDKGTGHIILSLPVEESRQIMRVWKKLRKDNKRQINKIIEKHKIMINRLKSSELAKKIV